MSENKKNNFNTLLWVLLIASVLGNTYLLIDRSQKSNKIEEQATAITEADKLNTELEKQYFDAVADLEQMRTDNTELNKVIDQQKEELRIQKEKVAKLIKSDKDLGKARAEMVKMRDQVTQYLAQIDQLTNENKQLAADKEALTVEKDQLSTDIAEARRVNEDLSTTKATLTSERETLVKEKTELTAKVNRASVIKVDDIAVRGLRIKDSGKAVEKAKAKTVDQLEVCFMASENKVTDSGVEQFFIRIINPGGETIKLDNSGSGIMVNQETKEQIPYTHIKGVQYDNEESKVCFEWSPNQAFQPGDYKIEVFNKGFLAGSSTFKLK